MTTQIKIENNVPIPETLSNIFRKLKVGDSFFYSKRQVNRWYWEKKLGFKFLEKKEGAGYRFWRIK